MDRLLGPFIILGFLPYIIVGKDCLIEECSSNYKDSIARANIADPEPSAAFCDILHTYQRCIKATALPCRGVLVFHVYENLVRKLEEKHCSHKDGTGIPKGARSELQLNASMATSGSPLPACRYFGSNKFRHCGFFGDPHLKTFDRKYQTCKVLGQWNLIDNPFMSVVVTNRFVVEEDSVTAPTKIAVVIKSRSTPCTLEKRYEADSEYVLPSTFVDGTDRPGADETVSLRWKQNEKESYETVEIYMKYIATKLVIRRIGKYLAFSSRLPEEVIRSSVTYNEGGQTELCTAGCPAEEQLNLRSARKQMMSREQALNECKKMENLDYEFKNNLTGSYLEWCVFDLMAAGLTYDFITVAHVAQSDALNMDPSSLQNGSDHSEWFPSVVTTHSNSGGGRSYDVSARTCIFKLVFYLVNSMISLRWLLSVQ